MWLSILTAVVFGAFVIFMFPRAKAMIKNSPKGTGQEWRGFAIIIIVVIIFVFMLIKLV